MSISGRSGLSLLRFGMWAAVASGGAFACGCALPDNTVNYEGKPPTPAPPASSYAYRYPDQVPSVSVTDLQNFVETLTRHQDVVLIDVWAAWCRQCRDELRTFSRLQEELADDGFHVVSVNLDPPSAWASETVPILHGAKANYPCLVVAPEQMSAMREWLAKDWNHDLPARFILNRRGEVIGHMFSGTPMAQVESEVRHAALESPSGPVRQADLRIESREHASAGTILLRLRLIDVRAGDATSLPAISAEASQPDELAEKIVQAIDRKVDRSLNKRIALAPFSRIKDSKGDDQLGLDIVRRVEQGLRGVGHFDLISPLRTQRLLQAAGLSAAALEYNPSAATGRLDCDYLILGWLAGPAGDAPETSSPQNLAGEAAEEAP